MGRRMLRGLTVALALLAASAAPAAAGGTITPLPDRVHPAEHSIAGPAFAGDAIAYAVPVGRAGFSVRVQHPDGTTSSQQLAAKGTGELGEWESVGDELAASPQVIALDH